MFARRRILLIFCAIERASAAALFPRITYAWGASYGLSRESARRMVSSSKNGDSPKWPGTTTEPFRGGESADDTWLSEVPESVNSLPD